MGVGEGDGHVRGHGQGGVAGHVAALALRCRGAVPPTEKEIQNAKEVIWAIREAEAKGSGVIALKGKMIDKPIVERAERVIALAIAAKLITEEDI